jgi:hypothetical protein
MVPSGYFQWKGKAKLDKERKMPSDDSMLPVLDITAHTMLENF